MTVALEKLAASSSTSTPTDKDCLQITAAGALWVLTDQHQKRSTKDQDQVPHGLYMAIIYNIGIERFLAGMTKRRPMPLISDPRQRPRYMYFYHAAWNADVL